MEIKKEAPVRTGFICKLSKDPNQPSEITEFGGEHDYSAELISITKVWVGIFHLAPELIVFRHRTTVYFFTKDYSDPIDNTFVLSYKEDMDVENIVQSLNEVFIKERNGRSIVARNTAGELSLELLMSRWATGATK